LTVKNNGSMQHEVISTEMSQTHYFYRFWLEDKDDRDDLISALDTLDNVLVSCHDGYTEPLYPPPYDDYYYWQWNMHNGHGIKNDAALNYYDFDETTTKVGLVDFGGVWDDHEDFTEIFGNRILGDLGEELDDEDVGRSSTMLVHATAMAGIIGAAGQMDLLGQGFSTLVGAHPSVLIFSQDMNLHEDDHTDYSSSELMLNCRAYSCRAINLSWRYIDNHYYNRYSFLGHLITSYLYDCGMLVVAARGNEANIDRHDPPPIRPADTAYVWPACNGDYMMSIGAHKANGAWANYSKFRGTLDLVAPGGLNVCTEQGGCDRSGGVPVTVNYPNSDYNNEYIDRAMGTSCATPHVTGTAALIYDCVLDRRNIQLHAGDLQGIIRATVDESQDEKLGLGYLDEYHALRSVSPPRYIFENISTVNTPSIELIEEGFIVAFWLVDGVRTGYRWYGADLYEVTVDVEFDDHFSEGLLRGEKIAWVTHNGVTGFDKYHPGVYEYNQYIGNVFGTAYGELVPGSLDGDGFQLRTYAYRHDNSWLPVNPLGQDFEMNFSLASDRRPLRPMGVAFDDNPGGHVIIEWNAVDDEDEDLAGYIIYRRIYNSQMQIVSEGAIDTVGTTTTSYEDDDYYTTTRGPLDPDVYFSDYWVTSLDEQNNESEKSDPASDYVSTVSDKQSPPGGSKQAPVLELTLPKFHQFTGNHPNPFNAVTKLKFAVAEKVPIDITVYNINGQKVFTDQLGIKEPGWYETGLNLGNVSSGFYICQMKIGDYTGSRRILFVK